jgi:hypothetical protein
MPANRNTPHKGREGKFEKKRRGGGSKKKKKKKEGSKIVGNVVVASK